MFSFISKSLSLYTLFILLLSGVYSFGQTDRFVGIVNNTLVEVNPFTPDLKLIAEIDVPTGTDIRRSFCYHPIDCVFYFIFEGGSNPQLGSIDFEGNVSILGEIINANAELSIAEGIAFNSTDNQLYISGGLDGFDFGAETLLTLNANNLEATFVTTLDTEANLADIDNMVIESNILYFNDAVPGRNETKFYQIDLANLAQVTSLNSFFTVPNSEVHDVVYFDSILYFTSPNGGIQTYNLTSQTLNNSVPYNTSQYNDAPLRPLEYIDGYMEFNYEVDSEDDISICEGESVAIGFDSGDYEILWSTGENTDSIIITQPGIYNAEILLNECPIFTTDSITVIPGELLALDQELEICEGEIIDFFGTEISEAGAFEIMISSAIGCDTIINLNKETINTSTIFQDYIICPDEELFIGNLVIDSAGTYSYNTNGTTNCDTMFIIDVTELIVPMEILEIQLCNSNTVEVNDIVYSDSGSFTQDLVSTSGCDSTLIIEVLNDMQSPETIETLTCEGLSVSINGETYESVGTYEQILTAVSGCDSIINVIVNQTDIYIPNVFSPKIAGNDTFGPFIPCDLEIYEFYIYDRWGNLVFKSLEKDDFWDGSYNGSSDLMQGVYTYMVRYGAGNSSFIKSGNVLMLL